MISGQYPKYHDYRLIKRELNSGDTSYVIQQYGYDRGHYMLSPSWNDYNVYDDEQSAKRALERLLRYKREEEHQAFLKKVKSETIISEG